MNIIYGFSDIHGGVSKGSHSSLNLGLHVNDDENLVLKNREIFANNLGFNDTNLIFMNQIHSDDIYIIDKLPYQTQSCDAIITNLKNLVLCVMVADCMPILMFDKTKKVISAIHAGRAGICKKIISKVAKKMNSYFGCKIENLELIAGPHIQGKCYEIGNLDLGKEMNEFKKDGYFYMKDALSKEIQNIGIQHYNISNTCTHCDKNYFSYRRDKITGRFCGYIYLT